MRAVLDTNVLISALLSRHGAPALALRAWLDGEFELIVSDKLLAEVERALAYPKIRSRIEEAEASAFVALLRHTAQTAEDPAGAPRVHSPDSGDDYLIALAEAAHAVIVSGDQHLLSLSRQLPVFSAADFLEQLAR